jgi:hypothetical protein
MSRQACQHLAALAVWGCDGGCAGRQQREQHRPGDKYSCRRLPAYRHNVRAKQKKQLTTRRCELTKPKKQLTTRHCELTTPKKQLTTRHCELTTPEKQLTTRRCELTKPKKQLTTRRCELTKPLCDHAMRPVASGLALSLLLTLG